MGHNLPINMNPIELQRLLHNSAHAEGPRTVLSGQIFPAGRQRTIVPRKVAFALGGLSALALGACSGAVAPVSPAAVGIAPQPIAGEPGLPPEVNERATAFSVTATPTRAPTRTPRPTRVATPTSSLTPSETGTASNPTTTPTEIPTATPTVTPSPTAEPTPVAEATEAPSGPGIRYESEAYPGMSVILDVQAPDGKSLIFKDKPSDDEQAGQDIVLDFVLAAIAGQLGEAIDPADGPVRITNLGPNKQLVPDALFDPQLPVLLVGAEYHDAASAAARASALAGPDSPFTPDDITRITIGNTREGVTLWYGWGLNPDGQLALLIDQTGFDRNYRIVEGFPTAWADVALALDGLRFGPKLVAAGATDVPVKIWRLSMEPGNSEENGKVRDEYGIAPSRETYWDAFLRGVPLGGDISDPNYTQSLIEESIFGVQ